MNLYENVTLLPKANIYFGGKVTSRTIIFPDQTKKTVGIMLPGEYTFSTTSKEEMRIISGKLSFKLHGDDWKEVDGSGVFYVPSNESFQLIVHDVVDYCCSYLA
ncbi:pyrimidine/purine nucleoside phosphorylase [Bacillus sp. 03113]|uniref:pyrimidine/purine nucleoside phosphorylase n=1 Tax=Bacillus sp. 03113 TaxID=2578211 RepID=UPI001144D4AD|nr:pyrimidine/purine nucleoside phosphorylase [Bacillus sp. 03113]